MRPKLLLATNNQDKVREYISLLRNIPFELVTLAEQGINEEVDESGGSLEENARLKATAFSSRSQLPALADDSGLEVDALNGEPGFLSSRYAGENTTNAERISYLLSRLKDVPREKRSARFRSVIVIATPEGAVEYCEGECRGVITFSPKGGNGFGYDPIFYLPELGKTMAELTGEQKNEISHRGQAARKSLEVLEKLWQDKYAT